MAYKFSCCTSTLPRVNPCGNSLLWLTRPKCSSILPVSFVPFLVYGTNPDTFISPLRIVHTATQLQRRSHCCVNPQPFTSAKLCIGYTVWLLIVYRLYTKNDYGLIYRIAKYDSQVSSAHDQATYDDSQVSYTK